MAIPISAAAAEITATNSGMAMGLSVSTFFGGSQFERAQGVAVDKDGFIYIAGNTSSAGSAHNAGRLSTGAALNRLGASRSPSG